MTLRLSFLAGILFGVASSTDRDGAVEVDVVAIDTTDVSA